MTGHAGAEVACDPGHPARVVIAGGGFAALEVALALRALAGERVSLTLISPQPTFLYRPAATVEAFGAPPRAYDLRAIVADLGARYRRSRLEAIVAKKQVRLASGSCLGYDALVVATGALPTVGIPDALTFRDQRDVPLFRSLLRELAAGAVRRLVFAVPPGPSWPLPLYELALLSATHAREHRLRAEISLVSPEHRPLAIFGMEASRLVQDLLDEHGVRFIGDSAACRVRRDHSLVLEFDAAIKAERVVAVPQLHGRRIAGLPASWWGFVPTDTLGRVEGLTNVYAAGDITTFPIKQGGLAAQQGERVAHTLAASLGLPVERPSTSQLLDVRLLGGQRPLFLRVQLDSSGHTATAALPRLTAQTAAPWTKVFARHLTPYLETRQPLARDQLVVGPPHDGEAGQREAEASGPVLGQ